MNYQKAYYKLLASFVDLAEEIENDEYKYLTKINEIIKQSDQTILDCERNQKIKNFINMLYNRHYKIIEKEKDYRIQGYFVIDEPKRE